jgi:hypothetical protein
MRNIISAALLVWVGLPASAEPITGNDLLAACETAADAQQGFCSGYIVGSVEGMFWGTAFPMFLLGEENVDKVNETVANLLLICEPAGVTKGQYVDITIAYLTDNPELRHGPARGLIRNALSAAFPCTSVTP